MKTNKQKKRERFMCRRCGECCKPIVKVSKKEIGQLKELGFGEGFFLDYDPFNKRKGLLVRKDVLKKKENGDCVFLRRHGRATFCSVYSLRPEVCREYPFSRNEFRFGNKCIGLSE